MIIEEGDPKSAFRYPYSFSVWLSEIRILAYSSFSHYFSNGVRVTASDVAASGNTIDLTVPCSGLLFCMDSPAYHGES